MFGLSSFPLPVRTITDWSQFPGSNTYFRTSDVATFVNRDGELVVYNAKGVRRSWGQPKVESTVTKWDRMYFSFVPKRTGDDIQGTETGWHKHTVSPVGGVFYVVHEGDKWVRRTAASKAVKAALA